jgi:dipeptidyl aminopeptidase/acylaminoacyl peptidase
MRKRVPSLVTVVLMISPAVVSAQEVMTPERLWQLKRAAAPIVSPDGRQFVFTLSEFDVQENSGQTDLYLLPVEGGTPQRVTDFGGRVSNPQWRPDGRRIGFLAAREDGVQLWEVNPDGSDLRQVSKIEGGIGNFRYAPTGTHVSFTRRVRVGPTIAEIHPDLPKANAKIIDELMYRHWDTWHDGRYSHLFIAEYREGTIGEPLDLMPGARFDTPLPPFGGVEQINWSPDGGRIAYTAKKVAGTEAAQSTDSDIYLYELGSGAVTNLTRGNHGYDLEPVFSPDGRFVAWLSMERESYEADRSRLFIHEFATGESRELTVGFDLDVHAPEWALDGRAIFFTSETRGTVQIYEAPLEGRIRQVTEGIHDYGRFGVVKTAAGPSLIAARMSMSEPTDFHRVEVRSGQSSRLSDLNADVLRPVTMGRVESRIVKATDGADILTWVIYPPGFDPNRRYPTLLYAQGGPQSALSQFFSYRWNFQALAAPGYIIVAPNRRGVPGFGQAFKEAVSRDWGGQAMQDLLSAIDDVAREPYVDRDRLGAIGPSFGGFTVFWLAGNHQKRFRTLVAHAGVFNLESMYLTTEELFFVNWDVGGPFWETPRPRGYDFSPHSFLENWETPMLVIHGELDFRVPVTEGMQAFTALQVKNIDSRFLYFPTEGHWILTPQNGILWHRVVFDWLERYLQPGTPAVPSSSAPDRK